MTLEHRVLVHLGFLLSHGLRFDRSAPLFNPFNPKYQSLFVNFSKPVLNLEPKDNCRSDWGQGWPREWVYHIVSYLFACLRCFWFHNPDVCHILIYLVLTCGLFKQPESWAFQSTFSRLLISAAFLQSDLNVGNVASSPRRGWILDGSVDLRG